MAVKYCEKEKMWVASYSKRHPITREPKSLRRKRKTKAEANRVYRQLIIEVNDALKRTIVPTWNELVDQYLESKRLEEWAKKTLYSREKCLILHTRPLWGDRLVDEVTRNEVAELFNGPLRERSTSHQRYIYSSVKAVFTFGIDCGYLNRNPCPRLKFQKGEKLGEVLTEEQVRVFLEKAKELGSEWYLHWMMAVYTGMRTGELYALTWDKVNLEQRLIKVDRAWSSKDGFKSTKSGDDRIIEMAPNLVQALKEHKLETVDYEFVLPRMRNWDKGEQARFTRQFLESIGLPSVRFHALRATWATIMLSKGVESIKVMKMGGWKSLKTMEIYIRKAGVDIKGITDALDLHNPSKSSAAILAFEGPCS